MSKYTEEDFKNAKFAEHQAGLRFARDKDNPEWWMGTDGDLERTNYLVEIGAVPVPDQVPGRTITESELRGALQGVFTFESIANNLGITVIPDPKPTNAEKLKALYSDWVIGRNCLAGEDLPDYLGRLGVKAPGGDDD